MRPYAWASIFIAAFALAILLFSYAEERWNSKAPVNPYIAVGAYAGTPVTAYGATSGGANHYTSLESPVGSDYTVPATLTLVITRLIYTGATQGDALVLGYGDDGVDNSPSAPTNPVSLVGAAGVSPTSALVVEAANIVHDITVYLVIPAGKHPFFQASGTAANVQIIGVEQ